MTPEQATREDLRWRILQCLECSGIHLMRELYIWRVLNDLEFFPSLPSLRIELNYLKGKGLIETAVNKRHQEGDEWMCKLTPTGTDYVQYATAEDIVGITRPPRP
jgi:hypothetical protein